MPDNPFATSGSSPGEGEILLNLLAPAIAVLEKLSYQYPLKLIAPAPLAISTATQDSHNVHTVFLLTYGGGLVAGDKISLNITLAPITRLVLLTQGSTKIFKSPDPSVIIHQHMSVNVGDGAGLCYLPDPVQPFEASAFEQRQLYNITGKEANLCVCDWVCEGRSARGESWNFRNYASRNEVWLARPGEKRRLLLRDNLFLDSAHSAHEALSGRMESLGIFGTLILCGPVFQRLAAFFLIEFKLLPRIGSRQWDPEEEDQQKSDAEQSRAIRLLKEITDGVLWTVAETRGLTVVKFGARDVEGAKTWLRSMLKAEGSVEHEFGERALMCLR